MRARLLRGAFSTMVGSSFAPMAILAMGCEPEPFVPIEPPGERVVVNPSFSTCIYDASEFPPTCHLASEPRDPCPGYRGDRGVWYEMAEAGAPRGQLAYPVGRFVVVLDQTTGSGALYDICASEWLPIDETNRPQLIPYAASAGSKIVVYGDGANAAVLDVANRRWLPQSTVDMPPFGGISVGFERHVVSLPGASVGVTYLNLDSVRVYSVDDDRWRLVELPPGGDRTREQVAFTVAGQRLFIWGGAAYDENFNFVLRDDGFLYDVDADTWIPVPAEGAPAPRYASLAAASGNDVVVWGGVDGDTFLGRVDGGIFNLETMTWRALPADDALSGRSYARMVAVPGGVLVLGGYDPVTGQTVREAARLDLATGRWTVIAADDGPFANFTSPALQRAFVATDGRIIVVDSSSGTGAWALNDENVWRPLDLGPLGRFSPSLVWTGSRLLSWSGYDINFNPLFSGAQIVP